ncbi:hypothetical protein E4N94_08930 [Treponema denticola]|uniref:hypothetical protein n=1 Tax=Treponema denticola TaxID=158 RepID=UPI003D8FFA88
MLKLQLKKFYKNIKIVYILFFFLNILLLSCSHKKEENYIFLVLNKINNRLEYYENNKLIKTILTGDKYNIKAMMSDDIKKIYYLSKIENNFSIFEYDIDLNQDRLLYKSDREILEFYIKNENIYLLQKENKGLYVNRIVKIDNVRNTSSLIYSTDDNKKYLSNLLICGDYVCTILHDDLVSELIIIDLKHDTIKKYKNHVAKIFNSKNEDLIILEYCIINNTEFNTSIRYDGNIGYLNIKTLEYIPLNQNYERRTEPVALNKQFLLIPKEVNYLWSAIKNFPFGAANIDVEYFIWDNQKKKIVDKIFKTNTSDSILLDANISK